MTRHCEIHLFRHLFCALLSAMLVLVRYTEQGDIHWAVLVDQRTVCDSFINKVAGRRILTSPSRPKCCCCYLLQQTIQGRSRFLTDWSGWNGFCLKFEYAWTGISPSVTLQTNLDAYYKMYLLTLSFDGVHQFKNKQSMACQEFLIMFVIKSIRLGFW